ncbi:ATPase [Candidatus Pacearchaeota archaeon]|nr:ATPase [Candidatus Pacearchaeota archaeon]
MVRWVIKASGERAEYNRNKIIRTLLRAGADRQKAKEVVYGIERELYDGVSTKEILKLALKALKDMPSVAMRYNLKNAIMSLGPSGFPFEKFFAEVLKACSYSTEIGRVYQGHRISQEVDITAKNLKTGRFFMVECKYHNQAGIYTDAKVAMYTYARFLDLGKFFDFPWLVSNTKFSGDAIKYAQGVGMSMTSWNYPLRGSLKELIESKGLYPVTILSSVKGFVKDRLAEAGIVTTKNLIEKGFEDIIKVTKLPENLVGRIISEARHLHSEDIVGEDVARMNSARRM